ncbi:hypothetical protein B1774_01595 [Dehalococcoides mccartyi]|nr:hypothetical protein B1773_01785 [Dehalococcoides mccartyi]AQU04139.1 hypothetical protein B1774_01595 [Dehalococcoides mccartyi]
MVGSSNLPAATNYFPPRLIFILPFYHFIFQSYPVYPASGLPFSFWHIPAVIIHSRFSGSIFQTCVFFQKPACKGLIMSKFDFFYIL